MTGPGPTDASAQPFPAAKPVRLADIVAYAEAAIVSRPIAKTAATKLVVFAFDAGQELSAHTAPFDAFVQVLDGEAALTIAATQVTAKVGDVVLMPARVPHAVRAATRMKMLLTMVARADESDEEAGR